MVFIGLVYFELHGDMLSAITREKQLKKWNRAWKLELIEGQNPGWIDLWKGMTSSVGACLDSRAAGMTEPERLGFVVRFILCPLPPNVVIGGPEYGFAWIPVVKGMRDSQNQQLR